MPKRPRGTNDILPAEAARWRHVEGICHHTFQAFGYGEVRTPIFESTELFRRGVGEDTDIVEKEMYTFPDRAGRSLTLRPEGTAPVVRSFLENGLHSCPLPVKLYYVGSPMFRYDRPQAGRHRQFHQAGAEIFGAADALADAEVVWLAVALLRSLGLRQPEVRLNSIGCPVCRVRYKEELREYYRGRLADLCPDCQRRFEENPLRLLDCKRDRLAAGGAPTVADHLCGGCARHFAGVQDHLRLLEIPFSLAPDIVRGLDYYTGTVFEIVHGGLGAQASVCGGGRYDGLVETCGGPPTPAVGFAVGMERLLLALEDERAAAAGEGARGDGTAAPGDGALNGAGDGALDLIDLYVAAAGEEGRAAAIPLVSRLRAAGVRTDLDLAGRTLKAQMKHAGRIGVRLVAIVGEEELGRGTVLLRDMVKGEQREIPLDGLEGVVYGARA